MIPPRTESEDRYLRLTELAHYTSLSVRTLKRFIADPVHPLPAHRFTDRNIVVKRSEFDAWVREREHGPAREVVIDTPITPARRAALAIKGFTVKARTE